MTISSVVPDGVTVLLEAPPPVVQPDQPEVLATGAVRLYEVYAVYSPLVGREISVGCLSQGEAVPVPGSLVPSP